MPVFIALYRGINVLGKNSVKMELLRAMHERLGHGAVTSYIQSGNIVFTARGSADSIARRTAAEFLKEFGFPAKLMVVDAKQLSAIVKANPFGKFSAKNHKIVHVGICQGEPDAKQLNALLIKTGGTEAFVTGRGIVYLHTPDGFGRSKFAAGMERACGVPMTARNWRTIESLWKLASGLK
jgi:uncharacterized protein (DUF1697 family)